MEEKRVKRIEDMVIDKIEEKDDVDIKQKVHNFRLEGFTKTGRDKWYIEGVFAKLIGTDIVLNKIKGETFGKDVSVTLLADRGIYNRDSGSTELKGNVIITTSDGGKVTMDFARWNKDKEEIFTDSYIKIEHGGIILEGKGALVKPKQKWAKLEKNIKAKDTSDRIITCDGPLEVDYEKREAIFNNNVEVLDREGKMSANKLIAYFDPDKRKIEKIEWLGDVKAVY